MFYNETDLIGFWIEQATLNITGSLFLTMFLIFFAVMMIFLMFRVPVELSATLNFPLMIHIMAYSGDFMAIGGAFLLYLGIMLGKYFPIGK